jgi:hypothetical protein
MAEWLTKGQQLCKSSDFLIIWNNLAEWGGTSDSHNLRSLVAQGYKIAVAREKK